MQPLHTYAFMASFALVCSAPVIAGCGAEDPQEEDQTVGALEANGGAGGDDAAGGAANAGGASSSSSAMGGDDSGSGSSGDTSSSSSGSGSTTASTGAGMAAECHIMSSNEDCAECLSEKCCYVINECMDEAYLSCVGCIDSFLSGDGDAGCEEVGKNHWIVECVEFNCETECAGS